MKLSELITILEEIAPMDLAEEFDHGRIGLIVRGSQNVDMVATALDPTPYAIKKASEIGAQVLVTHHTLIWNPVNRIDEALAGQLKLIFDNDLSLYSMHTNYDKAAGGVNDVLAGLVSMRDVQAYDFGRAGYVNRLNLDAFARMVSKRLGSPVEYVGDEGKIIGKVVVIGGSGFKDGLALARHTGADAVVSSELKHDIIRDRGNIALVNAPHYFTEAPAMKALAERLNAYIPATFIDDPPGVKVIYDIE